MFQPDHPYLIMILWVLAQIVCGVLGYFQGRKDEELQWRRNVDERPLLRVPIAREHAFHPPFVEETPECPDTQRSPVPSLPPTLKP